MGLQRTRSGFDCLTTISLKIFFIFVFTSLHSRFFLASSSSTSMIKKVIPSSRSIIRISTAYIPTSESQASRSSYISSRQNVNPKRGQILVQSSQNFGRYRTRSSFSLSKLFSQLKDEEETLKEEVDPGEVEGTDLRILKYPDPRLRATNAEISEFDEELKKTAKDMFKVMYASEGVGLAAPQVGINKRLLVFNPDGDSKKWLSEVTLVNPRIVEKSSKKDIKEEGCLSFPNMSGNVERSLKIKVEFENVKGKKAKKVFTGWEARIFQHEYDHLEGALYIDRLDEEGREKVQPILDDLIEKYGPGGAV